MISSPMYIHLSAKVSPEAHIGDGTRILRPVQLREHAHVRENYTSGKGVYIDAHVAIGSNVKIFHL